MTAFFRKLEHLVTKKTLRFIIRVMEWRIRRLERQLTKEKIPDPRWNERPVLRKFHSWYVRDLSDRLAIARRKLDHAQRVYVHLFIFSYVKSPLEEKP